MGNEVEEIKKHKDSFEELLKESLDDRRKDGRFLRKVILCLSAIIVILIGALVGVTLHNQCVIRQIEKESEERLYKFLREYDFETEITLDTNHIYDSDKSGNIFLAR